MGAQWGRSTSYILFYSRVRSSIIIFWNTNFFKSHRFLTCNWGAQHFRIVRLISHTQVNSLIVIINFHRDVIKLFIVGVREQGDMRRVNDYFYGSKSNVLLILFFQFER